MRGYQPPQTPEEQLLVRRVQEAAAAVRYNGGRRFLGFLDERGRTLAEAALHKEEVYACFWGGFSGAQRCFLGLGAEPVPPSAFPLGAVCVKCWTPQRSLPAEDLPGHRDYLGALLGLGLRRESVGDILTEGQQATCLLETHAVPLVLQELGAVGRFSAHCALADAEQLANWQPRTEQLRVNVPSLRLDAVLAALLHCSRADAAALITRGAVSLCHLPTTQPHAAVQPQDTISVRGAGRWRIVALEGQSKKGRLWLAAEHFVG